MKTLVSLTFASFFQTDYDIGNMYNDSSEN